VIEYNRNAQRSCTNRGLPTREIQRWTPAALWIVVLGCGSPTTEPGTGNAGTFATAGVIAGNTAGIRAAGGAGAGGMGVAGARAPLGATWPVAGPGCGDTGQDCALTPCTAASVCNVGVNLCLPRRPATVTVACTLGSCSDAEPYCLAGQCMSADQAICVCGSAGGLARVDACKMAPSAVKTPPNVCFDEESLCASAPDKCCPGLTCVQSPNTLAQCYKPCASPADCGGHCCADSGAGVKVCQPNQTC
jgi:hypothetical protein